MCGITGWIDWNRDLRQERATLQRMTDTLAARGPDGEGIWLSAHAGIGHRRLAVIDIAGGLQPMTATTTDGHECVLTYSGEIYNFPELRAELQGRGHRFRTRSDTEVVLRAYLEWGHECVTRLNGMFAFAVWDSRREELLLARDRLGVKPLFYAEFAGGLLFGSEIKALLANPLVTAEVDSEGLTEVLCLVQTPGHAVYRGIRSLPAGCVVRMGRTGCREIRYWQLEARPHLDDDETTVERVRELMDDIVARQLVADVPIGVMLSGGIDSSAVTALAHRIAAPQGRTPISTYSVHFAESEKHFEPSLARPELDTPFAREMAAHVGARHTELLVRTEDVLDAQRETLLAWDLPGQPDVATAQYLLFREAKRTSTVVLTGEAADELFGGYPWFHMDSLLEMPAFPWANVDLLSVMSEDFHRTVRPQEYLTRRYAEAVAEVPLLDGEDRRAALVRRMFYLNLTRWLTFLLDKKDRTSMRVGLEARVPFCDHRLVEYVWNVPWPVKAIGEEPKGLLRTAMDALLPTTICRRAKTAFPIAIDPIYDKSVRAGLQEELSTPNSALRDLVDIERVKALLKAEPSARDVWRPTERIARLAQLGEWLRVYRVRIL
ncbi:asparagine synthase (glutamine-hydrolyzing) [Micromonospora craniellae]|uniref:asparagine synthase (glutamine-hydrolyzing) n=1 Tax=Micromonospora craniellae TaxID=2294034 RepID=A0A372FY32_9ACTN|nr:asparagine synthase (glutamine-hydrolyzing) [Micromonospora craniellae]RFS45608.1 asparagine synthase (glutamine-hydrolyzing) [Micromonospora craniellae]